MLTMCVLFPAVETWIMAWGGVFSVFGDYCAEQPMGGWRNGTRPAEWTEQIVVYDRAVEIRLRGLKGRRLEVGAR